MSYKSIEVTGRTEEEAVEKALRELGLDRDDVSVELLERAKSGFLGLKMTPAKVKITYEVKETQEFSGHETKAEVGRTEKAGAEMKGSADSVPVRPNFSESDSSDERAKKAEAFLLGLFEKMNLNAELHIEENEFGISIELRGEKLGAIIGRRGETLDAIQHLTNYTVNRGMESRIRINLDAENYRKKREESLVSLAERMAGKAIRFKRSFTLEPMNSYERHVIHSALQTNNQVTTFSTGAEPNRRVVISYDRTQNSPPPQSSGRNVREWS